MDERESEKRVTDEKAQPVRCSRLLFSAWSIAINSVLKLEQNAPA